MRDLGMMAELGGSGLIFKSFFSKKHYPIHHFRFYHCSEKSGSIEIRQPFT